MMRELVGEIKAVLYSLKDVTASLSDDAYVKKIPLLSHASIGDHIRHVAELFQELLQGYVTGHICYDARKRDHRIATQRQYAIHVFDEIIGTLQQPNKDLLLHLNYHSDKQEPLPIATNYERELVFNLDHTLHHMALLRIGIGLVSIISLPEGFGVSKATLAYRKQCVR